MKNGKRPTKRQKLLMSRAGLNPENWLVVKNPPGTLYLVHRVSGSERVLKLGRAG